MTKFLSRPNLEDIQFKQTHDAVLTLSGLTKIATTSGLTLSDGAGGDITITASGASPSSSGYVLTYINGSISLQPSTISGATIPFACGCSDITRFASDPEYNVNVSATTVSDFLEGFFFPAVPPTSSISASNNSREFGDNNSGTLTYSAVRETNQLNAGSIDTNGDGILNHSIITGPISGDCSGSVAYSFPGNCATPTTSGATENTVSYGMCISTTANEVSCSSTIVTWKNKRFTFKSGALYNDDSITSLFTGGELSTTKTKTLSDSFNNQFFYYAYPSSFGTPSFTVNGLPNNAWGDVGSGTLYKIAYTNDKGYENEYYVARSDNRITGTYNIVIS